MEMMLVELLPGCHGRMPREPYRPRSGRLGAVDLSGWLWLFAFGGTAPSRLQDPPQALNAIDATRRRYVDFPKLTQHHPAASASKKTPT